MDENEADVSKSSEPTIPSGLADAFADLARTLQQEHGSPATLDKVVQTAIAIIPGTDEGSISVVVGRKNVTAWAASSGLPERVDALQSEVEEGPCLDAIYEMATVSVPDMATEMRWPRFAERAAELGAGSMLSFQLYVSGDNLGALNLYGRTANAFDEESVHVGTLFAAHAAIAFAAVRQEENLQTALDTRNVIGQAQGILMERHKVTAAQAFSLLGTVSQHRNEKLRAIAEELVASGALTGPRGSL